MTSTANSVGIAAGDEPNQPDKPVVGEAVAWQWRYGETDWHTSDHRKPWFEDETENPRFQMRALYAQPPISEDKVQGLVRALEPFALLAVSEDSAGVNMNDPLSKWITMAQLVEARALLASFKQEGTA